MSRWPTKRLGDVAKVIRGVSFDKSEVSDTPSENLIPILRAGNIQESLQIDSNLVFVHPSVVGPEQLMRRGDLAVCMSSGSPAIVGKSAYLGMDWKGSVGAFCAIVRFNPQIHHRFGFYWFHSAAFLEWRDSQAKGANIQNLRKSELENVKIPIPPLAEQDRIVRLLDEVDALRTLRAQADHRTADLVSALFHEMFRHTKFKCARVGDLTTLITSGSTPRGGDRVYVNEGPYFIRSQNVQMNYLDLSAAVCLPQGIHVQMARTKVAKGDVLLNITGASIGRVAWVDGLDREANVSQHVCLIRPRPDVLSSTYLSVFISLPSTQSVILQVQAGASRQALNHQQVRGLEIPLPEISLQLEFAAHVAEIRTLEIEQAASRRRLGGCFQATLSNAFKGTL